MEETKNINKFLAVDLSIFSVIASLVDPQQPLEPLQDHLVAPLNKTQMKVARTTTSLETVLTAMNPIALTITSLENVLMTPHQLQPQTAQNALRPTSLENVLMTPHQPQPQTAPQNALKQTSSENVSMVLHHLLDPQIHQHPPPHPLPLSHHLENVLELLTSLEIARAQPLPPRELPVVQVDLQQDFQPAIARTSISLETALTAVVDSPKRRESFQPSTQMQTYSTLLRLSVKLTDNS